MKPNAYYINWFTDGVQQYSQVFDERQYSMAIGMAEEIAAQPNTSRVRVRCCVRESRFSSMEVVETIEVKDSNPLSRAA